MKILAVSPGASYSTSDVADGLFAGLTEHGCQLIRYRLDLRIDWSRRDLAATWRRLRRKDPSKAKPTTADVFYLAGIGALEMALRHEVDVVLVVSAMFFHPDVIVLMRRAGLKVVVLFTESPYDMPKELAVAALVHGCWTCERSAVRELATVAPAVGYLPHAWYEGRHAPGAQPLDASLQAHDVVFVGSGFHERVAWLNAIDWTGIDLGLYGSWEIGSRHPLRRYLRGGIVDNATTAGLYRRAKIGLNLYRTSQGWGKAAPAIAHAESLNPRAYELARCGAFTLSTYRAEVPEIFGDLVPTFTEAAEASQLIRRWLADDAGRAQVQTLLPACVAGASWEARASQVLADLQMLAAA